MIRKKEFLFFFWSFHGPNLDDIADETNFDHT